jgi:hypothetical protein
LRRKHRRGSAAPMALIFVKPGSEARRAAGTQQHAQRFACQFGLRQSLAHEPAAASLGGVWCAGPPLTLIFVKPCSGARRATWDPTTRSTFRVRPWAPPMAWFTVKPCSGARRAAAIQQHAARAGLGAPVELDLRGAGFRGSPCYLVDKQHAQCFACGLGRPR